MGDANEEELIHKVRILVTQRFGGSYRRLFDHYAKRRSNSGSINRDELKDLLADAGVGNALTGAAWANAVVHKLDKNGDGFIAFGEFQWLKPSGPSDPWLNVD